ncbi:MAG TPA: S53 family peptidase [Kineosporiaceae bacterium]|nr:S53 family peptidase [Kineosporiaceae bacterium]
MAAARRLTVLAVALAALAGCTAARTPAAPSSSTGGASAVSASPSAAPSGGTPARPFEAAAPSLPAGVPAPPTTQECLDRGSIRCYSPAQLARAYDLEPLWKQGWTGAGRTIAIVDSFGSPTIREDLHAFDAAFGYPDPKLTIVQPAGKPPAFDRTNSEQLGWAGETTLDVEWAHAVAPGADILLVETPVAETEGLTGFPEIVKAETYVLDRDLADVISQSLGATEQTFASKDELRGQRDAFEAAQAKGVTVLAASGDDGPLARDLKMRRLTTRGVGWPATDPLVTAIGGTALTLDAEGRREAPDAAWGGRGADGASGGGRSVVFPRPDWQDGVRDVVGTARGVPDISMSAAVDGGALVWSSYTGTGGWSVIGGTSEATPLFAGVVAIADQVAGRRLGLLNPTLYRLAARGADAGIVDVTRGSNAVGNRPGFPARRGYDLATGLGTVDADKLVRALATAGSG